MVSLTATARLAGNVQGVVVHTDTAKPPPDPINASNAGVASVTWHDKNENVKKIFFVQGHSFFVLIC